MKKIISCNLMGGLGNQMFQLSHSLCKGWYHDIETAFIPKSYTPNQGRQTSCYLDNIFKNINFITKLGNHVIINEESINEFNIESINENIMYQGYFQSDKYFLGFNDRVVQTFIPPIEYTSKLYEKYPQLDQENTLSIHVRFGDYKKNPSFHPVVSKLYLENSISLIGSYSHLFLFGDDKQWLKENFIGDNITIIDEDEDYVEMWAMSLCKNNIISNSTFSWWGSFLNQNKNKKVIAPSMWFGPDGPNEYSDIYRNDFTIMEVNYLNGELIPTDLI
jgi:hypothetical protein